MRLINCLDWFWLAKSDLSPHTRADYDLTFRRLLAFLGNDVDIEAITHRDIQRFLAHIEEVHHLSAKSRCNAWIAISSLWRWASHELDTPNIIAGRVKMPAHAEPPIEPYTLDEVERLLRACETYTGFDPHHQRHIPANLPAWLVARNKAIILTLLDAGLRRDELCALNFGDLTARTGKLIVRHGKGDKARVTRVGLVARRAIAQYLAHRAPPPQADDPLFASSDGQRLAGNSIYTMIARLGARAGIKNAGIHRFRHTCATQMLRNGASERAVQELLGHESADMTRRYARFVEADLAREHELASPADNHFKKKRP